MTDHRFTAAVIAPTRHPRAQAARVLGLIGVIGFWAVLPLAASPLAWYYGASALRDIQREPGRWYDAPSARTSRTLGIIGVGLLAALILLLLLAMGLLLLAQTIDNGYPR